jgi:DNA-directed RNA polymerase subunit RPC12/RpoP
MHNLKCTTCGSNRLKKIDDHYQCEYCGATFVAPKKPTGKRITLILLIVLLIAAGLFFAYRMLHQVQESIDEIKTVATHTQTSSISSHPNAVPLDDENNPFEETFKEVKQRYGTGNITDTLYTTLKEYHQKSQHKALYLALSKKGDFAIGMASGEKSTQKAEEKAQALCETEKEKHPNLQTSCVPYAIDDHISTLLY